MRYVNVVVERGCLVSIEALINHNAAVHAGCHIDCGSVVTERAVVPEKTKVFANTLFSDT